MLFGIDISPKYLRGRIEALRHMYSKYMKENDEKGRRYLRMGTDLYKPDELELYTATFAKNFDNSPLSFVELTQFNTWFKLHPEKVAGTEKLTTSLHFPVTIKGKREDVERVLSVAKQKKRYNGMSVEETLDELLYNKKLRPSRIKTIVKFLNENINEMPNNSQVVFKNWVRDHKEYNEPTKDEVALAEAEAEAELLLLELLDL